MRVYVWKGYGRFWLGGLWLVVCSVRAAYIHIDFARCVSSLTCVSLHWLCMVILRL